MTDTPVTDTSSEITLSERAAAQISRILAKEEAGMMLRVAVSGGGCSGFQYSFDIVSEQNPDDLILEKDGAKVLVDEMSQEYMPGAIIDYSDEIIGAAFKIINPIASASCGCGTSFSI